MSIWPRARIRTPVKGDPIRSADFVKVQDATVGRQHGEISCMLGPSAFTGVGTAAFIVDAGGGGGFEPAWDLPADGDQAIATVPMQQGAVLTEVQAWVGALGTSRYVNFRVHILSPASSYASNVIGTGFGITKSIDPGGTIGTDTFTDADSEMPYTFAANQALCIELERANTGTGTADNPFVMGARIKFYQP